ncbi:unnamed protein product [Macrosiphum euphorbiae]|uniref:Cysteine-rich DPF motif domain-containing protein 1 n=1 Tax=Macrosiphum euphorbiae TaxID=13131 RepID=A0AAV0XLP6_9HEMI|nr:unnamed protein product [Macrosiphum euphorbiae]
MSVKQEHPLIVKPETEINILKGLKLQIIKLKKQRQLTLRSVFSMCDKDVCIKPECSIFYSKFFCSICARKYISNFPTSIQEKIKTTKRI